MTDSERSALEAEIAKARRFGRQRFSMLLFPSVMLVAVLAAVWAVVAWLARVIFGVSIGLDSNAAPWVIAAGSVVVVLMVTIEVRRTIKSFGKRLRSLTDDLNAGVVEEQELRFVEAKRFQEPEHGGLIYFLLTSDDRVYVQYDYESQDLGVAGKDPAESEYRPRATLKFVRTPRSELMLTSEWSGALLQVDETHDLNAGPSEWPESDTFCETPWPKLVSTYAA